MKERIIGSILLENMHKVWLDTNILVDYLVRRKPFETFAIDFFKCIEEKEINAFTSIVNLIHAHYQLRKTADDLTARKMIELISKIITFPEIPSAFHEKAIANIEVKDFEDAVQYELALLSQSNFLITRNQKDFPQSESIIICDAETYLKIHRLKE